MKGSMEFQHQPSFLFWFSTGVKLSGIGFIVSLYPQQKCLPSKTRLISFCLGRGDRCPHGLLFRRIFQYRVQSDLRDFGRMPSGNRRYRSPKKNGCSTLSNASKTKSSEASNSVGSTWSRHDETVREIVHGGLDSGKSAARLSVNFYEPRSVLVMEIDDHEKATVFISRLPHSTAT